MRVRPPFYGFRVSNMANPTVVGTSVVPGASDVEGSWTQLLAAASVTANIHWIELWVNGGSTSANAKNHLFDLGIDPAGGTAWQTWGPQNMICGQSAGDIQGGIRYRFPCFIPSGAAVACRVQGSNATAGTVNVGFIGWGQADRPVWPIGEWCETVGTITGSLGVSITMGGSGGEAASWTSLGTLTNRAFWAQLCVQIDNGTLSQQQFHFDLAYGDASNKVLILENQAFAVTGSSEAFWNAIQFPGWCDVPAGATIYARGSSAGSAPTGVNAVAIFAGGIDV